jgi:hypothetical protein
MPGVVQICITPKIRVYLGIVYKFSRTYFFYTQNFGYVEDYLTTSISTNNDNLMITLSKIQYTPLYSYFNVSDERVWTTLS